MLTHARTAWTKFEDQNYALGRISIRSTLDFASSFTSALQQQKFPQVTTLTDYKTCWRDRPEHPVLELVGGQHGRCRSWCGSHL